MKEKKSSPQIENSKKQAPSGKRSFKPNLISPDIRKYSPNGKSPWIGIATAGAILIVTFIVWNLISTAASRGDEVALSTIVKDISDKKYDKIILRDDIVIIENNEKKVIDGKDVEIPVREHALLSSSTDFYERLDDAGIDIKTIQNDFYEPAVGIGFGDIISIVLLGAGVILVFMMVRSMQASGGRLMDFGQSKARLIFGKKTGVTFNDVAGIDEVKEELVEIVDFLKKPKKYIAAGARIPKGVLLVGAPGTGKTLLARSVAGEAGVPFFHTSGSEFEEMLVGAGASRVRDLFTKAKRAAPCILFIDEIDAVAKKRGTVLHSAGGEQTLNQILVEMDGLETRENVIVLAATNRPDVLDPAILRPGRFDRTVTVQMPDYEGRLAILRVHAKNKKFDKNADLETVARKTVGYSGADLENLLNEAAIMAAKDERSVISQSDLIESHLKVKLGRQKRNKRTEDDIKRVAYHEAGHAVVAKLTPGAHPVEKISIISRGDSGGVTVTIPEEEETMTKKSQLYAKITTLVSGKVAEELFMEEMTTGASSDIKYATELARLMVQKFGMNERLGFVSYGNIEDSSYLGFQYNSSKEYSEKTAEMIDEEVRKIMEKAQKSSKRILTDNKALVEKLVSLLIENEEVDRKEFDSLFE
ncbi:ATP-dependent zinc metalloprotease FtsH [Candidatus Nomurabacteria bacterium]|nr:ATP-dependent zinc metalloprotease FtsH [Candidatus Nomurabacteria bacterium]